MSLSIRTRTLVAMNALAVALALLFGWLAGRTAAQVVEERLARELLRNTSRFLAERHLPTNDAVVRDLRRIFGIEFLALGREAGDILACSLDGDRAALARAVIPLAPGARLNWAGRRYRVDTVALAPSGPAGWLFALVPEAFYDDARREAFRRTVAFVAPAVLAASLLAAALALTISRPLRRLAAEMDRLADAAVSPLSADAATRLEGAGRPAAAGPAEVAQLADSFHHLLGELRKAQDQLAQASRLAALGRLAATVAHELKNPLSGIQMNLRVLEDELQRRGFSDPSLEVIHNEIDRMDLHLQELMLLARPPPGGTPGGAAAPGPAAAWPAVALAEVAESVLRLLAARCEHAGVRIVREFAAVPAVRGHTPHLRQVLMNLVVNALEAMPAGGTLTLRILSAPAGGVACEVRDSGGGVTAAPGQDIFDVFVSSKPGNAGLGLHVCRQIVQEHGGRIEYENFPEGCCFRVLLPAVSEEGAS